MICDVITTINNGESLGTRVFFIRNLEDE